MNPDMIDKQRIAAHEFTRSLIPAILTPAVTETLNSTYRVIEGERQRIEAQARTDIYATEKPEVQKEIADKAMNDFLGFQNKLLGASTQSIRMVVWNLVSALTADYFPDLVSEELKRKEEKNGDQATEPEEVQPRVGVLQGSPEVDTGEDLPEPQEDSPAPRPSGFREPASS